MNRIEPQVITTTTVSSQDGNITNTSNDDTTSMMNPLLLEARYLQLLSSIRALHRSNQELQQALQEEREENNDRGNSNNDNDSPVQDTNPDIAVYQEAINENEHVMRKYILELVKLIRISQSITNNTNILDIPPDIQLLIHTLMEDDDNQNGTNAGDTYTILSDDEVVRSSDIQGDSNTVMTNNNTAANNIPVRSENHDTRGDDDSNTGVYL